MYVKGVRRHLNYAVEGQNNFQPLQHALTYIIFDGMVRKA